ncbi:MAG: site-specific DNA-methyltransferase [Planctomycetaceae bacterium]|jgi:site-specific DNA-methyltransferase (adenine-specific)|nr:site-specific DNA-methyltransferase [Planctomycetaceae bacterium]
MFYNLDCIEGAQKYLKSNSVNLIICDPPYGINGDKLDKHYNRDESNVLDGYVEVSQKDYPEFSARWINEAARVLRPGGSIYIVSGYSQLRHILNALANTELQERNHIIWKYNFGVYTSKKFISSHYHILYYVKPPCNNLTFNTNAFFADNEKSENGGSMNYLDREDVWIINREYKPGQIKNKNELPKSLLTKMILYSSNPNDMVCDFFLGSFSTAKIAIGLGRQACGFELNKNAFDYQIKEIEKIKSGELLPELRNVPENKLFNKGKPLTQDEIKKIITEFSQLTQKGITKKMACNSISEKYGRGYWSILNIVSSLDNLNRKPQTTSSFFD